MNDPYSWWRKALEIGGGRELTRDQMEDMEMSESDPQPGFYRKRIGKEGPYVPVAIWRDENGDLVCLQNGKMVETDQIERVWTWCLRWPISEALYREVANGGAWPDEPPVAPKDHNQVQTGDPCEDLRAEFMAEKELADEFLQKPVETQEQADQLAVWAKKVAGIRGKADTEFKAEKQPWLDGGKKVDDRWRWRQEADAIVKALKRAADAFLNEQRRKEEERRKKAQEEADQKKRAAEDAARKAQESEDAEAKEAAEKAAKDYEAAERETKERDVSAGRTGARVSLHTYYEAKIVDYDKLLMALKDQPEVREAVEKIANRLARTKGATMPEGSERAESRRAA